MNVKGGRRRHSQRSEQRSSCRRDQAGLLPMSRPTFLEGACLRCRSDPESTERQDYGANTDVWIGALANMPTARTFQDRGMDAPFRSDPLKLRVQFIAQLDECVAGYAVMPLRAQPLNHFGKPDSLGITGGHGEAIVLPATDLAQTLKNCRVKQHCRPGSVPEKLTSGRLSRRDLATSLR